MFCQSDEHLTTRRLVLEREDAVTNLDHVALEPLEPPYRKRWEQFEDLN